MSDYHDIRTPYERQFDEKDAEITRLRAELDGLRTEHASVVRGWQSYEKRTAEAARRDAEEITRLQSALEAIARLREALEWIEKKTKDKRNPAVAFVCRKLLDGEDFSPLHEDAALAPRPPEADK